MNLQQHVVTQSESSFSSARSHRFAMAKPAVRWQDALPSGNGTMGALVYGNIEEDTIVINHEALWYGGLTKPPPDLSVHLPELRALLDAGQYEEANRFFPDLMRAAGYQTHTSRFQPGFELKVTLETEGAFRDYSRTLDMETGEITVAWTDNGVRKSKRTFVSRPDQMIVMSVRYDGAPIPQAAFALHIYQPAEAEKHGFRTSRRPNPVMRSHRASMPLRTTVIAPSPGSSPAEQQRARTTAASWRAAPTKSRCWSR